MAMSLLQTAGGTSATVLLLILHVLAPHSASLPTTNSILLKLTTLQSQSPSGVIHLNNPLLEQILSLPTPRPFHFIIFFDAKMLHSKSQLALPKLKFEYSIVSSSFHANNKDRRTSQSGYLFFFEIEYEQSQSSFSLFGVNYLPHIRLVPPSATDMETESIAMDNGYYTGYADSFVQFIQSRTDLSIGTINRPPLLSKSTMLIITGVIFLSIPAIIKKLLSGNTLLHNQNVWMAGAIFVYFFSVSGTMFNIIRKMPMVLVNKQDASKLVFFYKGFGSQLGAEGFTIGFLYTAVGMLLAFMTHSLIRVESKSLQRVLMVGALLGSFWAVNMVVYLDNWKTGYRIRSYVPSSWQ